MITDAIKKDAIKALDGMEEIVRNERIWAGTYLSEIEDTDLAKSGAICGGRYACAIGSLWLGAGIKPTRSRLGGVSLPGVIEGERDDFMQDKPGLRLAYDCINTAATEFAIEHNLDMECVMYDAAIEGLFETHWENADDDDPGDPEARVLNHTHLINIIGVAKETVAATDITEEGA